MKLHYSQTHAHSIPHFLPFDYHMKLHYSQTYTTDGRKGTEFDYHMKLHYSQTAVATTLAFSKV